MKFGLFYEHQIPRPRDKDQWDPDAEHKMMKNALDQIELADQLGFDYIFEVEHHFLEEYSHSSAPEVFLAAASQRTKNIRLGHGITLMPPRYNHPARVAERIATLDLVSDGRVEFGTGESASEMEMGGFGVRREDKKQMWEEATREVIKMMTQTPYKGTEGQYFGMPSRNVIPKPLQKPHPPLWVASSRRETTMVAARLGMGSLGFAFETPDEAKERADEYFRLVREECYPIGEAINPALAAVTILSCFEDDEEAIAKGMEGAQFFAYSLAYYYNPFTGGNHKPGQENIYKGFIEAPEDKRWGAFGDAFRGFGGFSGGAAKEEPEDEVTRALWRAAQRGGCIGSPDFVTDTLRKYEDSHLDLMIFVAQCGARSHEDVMDSLYRTGTKVIPEFKERHEKHQKWREEQLAGVEHEINSTI
ncbi:MAG: LLM class flavin-dependent oxidoreductase [Chloroflexi bacterium]|nr:LLM class flavin-dependent oxidoreductase [Chloroflexota bacterium]MCI0838604.1 LLM class flavin-dependent oxidoreductase [Chloroflexota bacterium]